MKIYYFGELIEDTNALKAQKIATQMTLSFDEEPLAKTGMPSIGDILKELDLSLDVYRPFGGGATI